MGLRVKYNKVTVVLLLGCHKLFIVELMGSMGQTDRQTDDNWSTLALAHLLLECSFVNVFHC